MTEQTFNRRLNQLIAEVENHNHRDELLKLVEKQLLDDTMEVIEDLLMVGDLKLVEEQLLDDTMEVIN